MVVLGATDSAYFKKITTDWFEAHHSDILYVIMVDISAKEVVKFDEESDGHKKRWFTYIHI